MPQQVNISISDLIVAYDGVNVLSIPALKLTGSTIMLLGHNGSGKSTLLKAALQLLPWKRGKLILKDEGGGELSPTDSVAYCPENGAVFNDIPVARYLELWSRIKHGDSNYYRKEGKKILPLLDIEPLLGKMGRELSKGQRRRVQIAVCFLLRPKVILFDEPFDGLDIQQTEHLVNVMKEMSPETAYLVSTHRMDVVERCADTLLVLADGGVAASGSVEEVTQNLAADVQVKNLSEAMGVHLRARTDLSK